MQDLLESYVSARQALSEYFDNDSLWYNVVIYDKDTWTENGSGDVYWELLDDDSDDWNYSIEIYGTSRWESKDGKYTMFVGNDGCGNRDCYVFLNSLKKEMNEGS